MAAVVGPPTVGTAMGLFAGRKNARTSTTSKWQNTPTGARKQITTSPIHLSVPHLWAAEPVIQTRIYLQR